jgi:hypothetical protein
MEFTEWPPLIGGPDDEFLNQAIAAWHKFIDPHFASSGARCLYKIDIDFILMWNDPRGRGPAVRENGFNARVSRG